MSDMNEPTHVPASPVSDLDDDEISLLDLLQVVVENLRFLVLGSLTAGLFALGISYLITPSFTATTKIMPPQQQQSSAAALLQNFGALGGIAGIGIKNPSDQYIAFLQSRMLQEPLIKRFKLMERYEMELAEDARVALIGRVRISTGKDGLITISVDDANPAFAAELANAHVSELSELLSRLAITEAQQRRAFFEKQLTNAKDNLIKAELALQTTGVNAGALKANPAAAVGGLALLQANIAAQEIKVASMRGYLAESASDFKQAMTELSALRTQLRRAEQSQSPSRTGDNNYISKYRDFKYYETLSELFAKQYEVARIDESREGALIQVLDVAVPPLRKSNTKKSHVAVIATLAAGFFLLLFVFLRQAIYNAVEDQANAHRLALLRHSWRKAVGKGS
jgi:tyrosine-protein kinase Etk/Wzc